MSRADGAGGALTVQVVVGGSGGVANGDVRAVAGCRKYVFSRCFLACDVC